MKKFLAALSFFCLVQVLMFAAGNNDSDQGQGSGSSSESGNFSLGTGGQSGIYYPFGGAIAQLWSQEVDGINVKAEVTAASVENTIKVASDAMIAGFAQSNVVEQAYLGTGRFDTKLPVEVLVPLYPNIMHMVLPVDTNIESLSDLKGKRVSLGAPASGTAVTSENVLKANGVTTDDFDDRYLNYSETTNALANGQIDAGFLVGGLGVGAVTELALTKDITIYSLSPEERDNFIKVQPIYSPITVPSGVYNKVGSFDTVAIWNALVVKNTMSEDLAYKLVKVIYENNDYLTQVVKSAQYTTPENSDMIPTIPLHPGTLKYLGEL